MGVRFRKTVKLGKGAKINFSKSGASLSLGGRGHSANFGKRGTYVNAGIPGTGLSYRTKVGKTQSAKTTRGSNVAPKTAVSVPGKVAVKMNDKGRVVIEDVNGNEITDQSILRKIKATPEYKNLKEQLEAQRRKMIDQMIQEAATENNKLINIYKLSPVIDSKEAFQKRLEELRPKEYREQSYDVPYPTEDDIRKALQAEAKENVKASIFKVGKLRKQYVDERFEQALDDAITEWEHEKSVFLEKQTEKRQIKQALYQEEYENEKEFLSKLIDGEVSSVTEVFDSWFSSCELPVDVSIDYNWDPEAAVMLLDVDLPEIESLPDTKMTKTESGNLKEKKKTQGELREEYAKLVFGLAIFIASNAFNTSPAISKILISAYTQRRDKEGNLVDDYIYSLKFDRESMEDVFFKKIDMSPIDYCMAFKNRCNLTKTMLFKAIKPFDSF